MREIRMSGSEGGGPQANAVSLPLSQQIPKQPCLNPEAHPVSHHHLTPSANKL